MVYNYEEKILVYLVEGYRRSKKDTGDNRINRRTKLKPEKLYNKYHANDGNFDKISAINDAVRRLTEKGYVTPEVEKFGTELTGIYLVDTKIQEIEKYLITKYDYITKDAKLEKLEKLTKQYQYVSDICHEECKQLSSKLQKRVIPSNLDELDDILKAIGFIENNKENLYVREMSMEVYGKSKYFEKNMVESVCSILNKYNESFAEEYILNDEILKKYHIFKEAQKLSIKGSVIIRISGIDVDISGFEEGIEFSTEELSRITHIKLLTSKFITIENRISYLRYKVEDSVLFYLGGYMNRYQREFIKMIYKDNPGVEYWHFGDIDAGGFWIHHHLCEATGIQFGMLYMSVKELSDPKYEKYLQPLSDRDIDRMRELAKMEEYSDVVKYMLKNNVKLEQEIISLRLMRK